MSHRILVNRRQSSNEILKKFTRVGYEFSEIEPDFVVGRTACVLYLSLRYHALHPNYIFDRINMLGQKYDLRVLLVVVDHIEHQAYLKELSKVCIRCNFTLMLAWSVEDAAIYLEKYKLFENKPADPIMERPTSYENEDALDQYLIDALAESRSINRTDATSIVGIFDNFERISMATQEELALCPGVGMQKAQRLHELLHKRVMRDTGQSSQAQSSAT